MPREKELYHDILERIRKRADEKYTNKLLYTQQEAAAIVDVCAKTLQNREFSHFITAEQLARTFS